MIVPRPPSSPHERLTPTDAGLALLALASGSSDAIAFLTLGKTFTSAMTGNTALLGIAVSQGHLADALSCFSALGGFVVGAVLAATIGEVRAHLATARALRPLYAIEAVCLVAFAVLWSLGAHPIQGGLLFGLILLSAAGMGIQSVIARRINAPGINTIVFTSTLVSIIMSIVGAVVRRARPVVGFAARRQAAIFVTYAIGATAGGVLTGRELAWVAFLPLLAFVGAFACGELDARRQRRTHDRAPIG
jgi:uncharacterized membrane protein YoaK (UPF0700 family)